MLILGAAVVLFMWFGSRTITNGRPDIAGQLAQGSPRELHSTAWSGLSTASTRSCTSRCGSRRGSRLAIALLRRNWVVVALAAWSVVWAIVEIAFAYHGWPALPRYVFEAAESSRSWPAWPSVGRCSRDRGSVTVGTGFPVVRDRGRRRGAGGRWFRARYHRSGPSTPI